MIAHLFALGDPLSQRWRYQCSQLFPLSERSRRNSIGTNLWWLTFVSRHLSMENSTLPWHIVQTGNNELQAKSEPAITSTVHTADTSLYVYQDHSAIPTTIWVAHWSIHSGWAMPTIADYETQPRNSGVQTNSVIYTMNIHGVISQKTKISW
ncbi:hypothetical protein BDZ94DRAFT_395382 [Collybia nuda]|uniref:Uncharacterized protein n=1 Tax=Collybia nuda TaxID=64659 RepID=A0A9P6CLY3_9AGAR|nr:hypothetical protein BDZ94DRAFT_395382 [Collybia nuda]